MSISRHVRDSAQGFRTHSYESTDDTPFQEYRPVEAVLRQGNNDRNKQTYRRPTPDSVSTLWKGSY